MTKTLIALACIASGTTLVALGDLSAELFVGTIVGPILAGVTAAGAAAAVTGKGGAS